MRRGTGKSRIRMRGLSSSTRWYAIVLASFVAATSSCAESKREDHGGAGEAGSSGEANGGSAPLGGSPATGGTSPTGGTPPTGGTSPSGGNAGDGGSTGGGTAGSGAGAAGSGGGGGGDECLEACTTECPCPRGIGSLRVVCVSPGDALCGGPAPPPPDCAIDADCAAQGETMICLPTGHCDTLECVAGCTAAEDCTEAEACGADHHCSPKPCSAGVSCGPNHRCGSDGFCERTPCERSADCDDLCVNRLCYDEAGRCGDPTLP